jgi:hypothetical protein
VHVVLQRIAWFALLACPLACVAAADSAAIVTLLEGDAALVRGAARYALAEGVRLRTGDIIEVADNGLAQIEYFDGAALALGPRTRLLTVSASRGKATHGDYYVIRGVLKLTGVKAGSRFRFATPVLTVQPIEGSVVLLVAGAEGSVFAETGETRVSAGGPPLRLGTGDFCSRRNGKKASVALLPSKAFIAALPRLFVDPLPPRMALYEERGVEPKRLDDEVSYAHVEAWLKAPRAIRRPLVARFEPLASDAAFRASLVENLKYHPEWSPVLYPAEKDAAVESGVSKGFVLRDPVESKTVPLP